MKKLLVALMVVVAANPAVAHTGGATDPKDFGGRRMDIRAIRHAHGTQEGRVRHTITMNRVWRNRMLRRGHYVIGIYFDIFRAREEREIWIDYRRGELQARMSVLELTRQGKVRDFRDAGRIAVWRPDGRKVKVAFDTNRLNLSRSKYRWNAVVTYDAVCAGSCPADFAPDRGWVVHDL